MSLFKNKNEEYYVGGKKHFVDVIKNTGSDSAVIWRQPEEDFNTGSTLVVMPGEEAIFINQGNIEQVFDNGTYILTTDNYPFISRLRNAFSGGISTFNAVVYFVRKATSREIFWGTDSPIRVRDKFLGIETSLKVRGSYRYQIDNGALFLNKILGNGKGFLQSDIEDFFVSEFQSKIRSAVSGEIQKLNTELLGIESRIEEISEKIMPNIQGVLSPYGITCLSFVIDAIDIDDSQLRRRYDEVGIENINKLRNAEVEVQVKQMMAEEDKKAMDTLGDRWSKLQSAEILKSMANNPGSIAASVASIGAGIGLSANAAGAFNSMTAEMLSASDKASLSNSDECFEVLSKLKKMLDMNLITQEEYNQKKAEILSRM